jgi:hypothetical protein
MIKRITFEVDLFRPNEKHWSRLALLEGLEALCRINQRWLSEVNRGKDKDDWFPPLYQTKVIYKPENNTENWKVITRILQDGYGDCEDLSCWRIAELRYAGINAKSYLKWKKIGKIYRYHALVALPNGQFEDPSLALGMSNHPIVKVPIYVSP